LAGFTGHDIMQGGKLAAWKAAFKAMLVAAGVAIGPAASLAQLAPTAETCTPITSDEVEGLFERWGKSLLTGHPDRVTRNYAPDAVLLATTSNTPRTTYAEIRDYYFNFLQREPRVRNESRKIRIGCNVVTDAGVYSFTIKGPVPGTVATLKARYTFIYEQRDGAWRKLGLTTPRPAANPKLRASKRASRHRLSSGAVCQSLPARVGNITGRPTGSTARRCIETGSYLMPRSRACAAGWASRGM